MLKNIQENESLPYFYNFEMSGEYLVKPLESCRMQISRDESDAPRGDKLSLDVNPPAGFFPLQPQKLRGRALTLLRKSFALFSFPFICTTVNCLCGLLFLVTFFIDLDI